MPSPNTSLSTLRPDLGGSFEQFNLDADRLGFVGLQALPVIEVGLAGDTFGKIPLKELLRTSKTERGAKGGYQRDDFEFEQDSYATKEHGFESPVDDNLRRTYRHYFDAEMVAARRARDRVLRNGEIRTAALLQDTGTFGNAAAAAVWTNHASATPITDVETAVQAFFAACGMWPNAIIIPKLSFRHARLCDQVRDYLNSVGMTDVKPNKISPALLAQAFDLERVLVPGSAKNSANEGQTASIASLWDKTKATLIRIPETDDIQEPCTGRTFHWDEDGSEIGGAMETYRDETVRGDVVRCRHQVHEKVIYSAMGRIITGINA